MRRFRSLVDGLRSGAWVRKGIWTLSDQALFAGANFVVNVLLARWLTPESYGAYTVAYTVFLLLGTIHGGYFSEPMLVYGAGRFERRLRPYLRILLGGQARFSVGVGLVLGAGALGAWATGQAGLAYALGALAVGQGAILFQWQMRAACYIRTQPHLAATTGVLYAGLVLAGAWALNASGGLNEATAIGLMAGASLAAATAIALRLRIPLRPVRDPALSADVYERHRDYGGWAAGTGILEWYNGFIPFLLLPLWAGLADTGGLRALFNLVLPVVHVFHAFAHLLIPVFVRAGQEGALRKRAFQIGGGILAIAAFYALCTELVGARVLSWLYEGKYDDYAHLLWLVGILPLGLAVSNLAQAVLRSQERPQAVFMARGGAAVVASVTLAAAFTFALGVAGALLATLLAAFTEAGLMVRSLLRGGSAVLDSVGPDARPDARRRRVLMVAFACGPGRGSEPGQGWQFAHRMAAHHDVTALVYSGFRKAIERELAERPVAGLRVAYVRLPFEAARHWRDGVDRAGVREQLHYHAWNLVAGRRAQRLHADAPFDLVHHASFMRYWSPSAGAALADVPFVWGPVGGGETAPRTFYPVFSAAGRRAARLRDRVRSLSHRLRSVRRTAQRATVALATTEQSAARMRQLGARDVRVAPASVALPPDEIARLGRLPAPAPGGPLRFTAAGRLLHWKGYGLALDAFARASAGAPDALADATFSILGEGPEADRLAARAQSLGLGDRVRLHGHVPRAECLSIYGETDVFVHPSFHDSGGYATLEAMAARRPVVCLDLGGPGLQVTPATGVAVEATTPEQVVEDLARAFRRLAADPALRRAMGEEGRERVEDRFTWGALIADTLAIYDELLPARPAPAPRPSLPLVTA